MKLQITGMSPARLPVTVADVLNVQPRPGSARDAHNVTGKKFVDFIGGTARGRLGAHRQEIVPSRMKPNYLPK
jgi:hypothetical protein